MNKILNGKVIVITGAGRGIGRAMALTYSNNGATVCCIARHIDELEETVSLIQGMGGTAMAIACDVTHYQDIEEAFAQVQKSFQSVDIVVINAGIDCDSASVEDLDIHLWESVINVNLTGALYTAKAAIPYLKERKGGKIITLGSGIGHKGRANKAPYACSKAGLWMLTRVLAQELSAFNISVNELIPGPVDTSMKDSSINDKDSIFHMTGEWVKTPEDIENIALFLATQPLIGPTAQSFSLMRRDL